MVDFLMRNPLLIIVLVLVFMYLFVVMFLNVKKKKDKPVEAKEEKTESKTKEEKPKDEKEEKPQEEKLVLSEKKKSSKKKVKKTKEKPKIEQVYQKVETKKEEEKQPEYLDEKEKEFMKDRQFVKTSKTVSKVVRMEEQPVIEEISEELPEEQPIIKVEEKKSRIRERVSRQKHGHFDRSKRLRRCIECDNFDDMFESHISEDYLNFDVDTHLRKTEIITDSLYKRASETLANSSVKILGDDEESEHVEQIRSNKDSMKQWIEDRKREELAKIISHNDDKIEEIPEERLIEDINLDAKNILVVDSILHRKSLNKTKKNK